MSWLFSRALVAEYLQATCSDGEQSSQLSVMPTPHKFWRNDKMMEPSQLSRFGLTCAVLTEDLGAALLTWFREGFRAKTSVLQDEAQESPEPGLACGRTWLGSLARFDPSSSTWKTVQPSLLEDSDESSVIWPRSGMTAAGLCWELPPLELYTSETGSGLWPTPTCPNGGRSVAHVTDWRSERTAYSAAGKKVQVDLAQAVKRWPTPTVCGNHNRKGASATSGDGLATAVKMWATPIARDRRTVKGGARTMNSLGSEPLITQVAQAEGATDGALNPAWVEWLMGWPIGWTDLKPLAMDRCHSAQQQHLTCSQSTLQVERMQP